MLTEEQFIEQLRSALRTNGCQPRPDLLERVHDDLALGGPRSGVRGALVTRPHLTVPGVLSVLSTIVVVAIAVGALALLGHARHRAATAVAALSERQLVAEYAVLRRPQTAADRSDAGPLDLPARSRVFRVGRQARRLDYVDIPSLTRVVRQDGVTVSLFVLHITLSGVLPASARPAAARGAQFMRRIRAIEGYSLWARVAGAPDRHPRLVTHTSTRAILPALPAPGDLVVAVVPDNVAHVTWTWPRLFNTTTLDYNPPLAIAATAHGNIAVATAARAVAPETATWEAAGGGVLARINSVEPMVDQYATNVLAHPAPETALSRRAERDPSTPNRVVIAPDVGSMNTRFNVFFRALLTGRDYVQRITGGPRPGCVKPIPPHEFGGVGRYGQELYGDPRSISYTVRGETFSSLVQNAVSCPGMYRLSISVLSSRDRPFPPFGSTTFTVR